MQFRAMYAGAIALLATGSLATSPARAAINYTYVAGVANVNVAPGGTTSVLISLRETVTSPSTSRLAGESGLSSASFGVNVVTPAAGFSFITGITGDPAFNDTFGPPDVNVAANGSSATIVELVDIAEPTGPTGAQSPPGTRTVPLGRVQLKAAAVAGVTTTFRVSDLLNTNDTVTIDGFNSPLDPLIAATTFTVTVTPEPTTATIVAAAATLALASRRRSRRRAGRAV